jgi:hypothetical protein
VGIPSDPYSDLERFEALRSRAERYEVAGCSVYVADLADIVASKRLAMRPSDIEALPELEALLADRAPRCCFPGGGAGAVIPA